MINKQELIRQLEYLKTIDDKELSITFLYGIHYMLNNKLIK